jgi:hypothetical protein
LLLEGFVRLLLWQSSLALTMVCLNALRQWPARPPIGADWATVSQWAEIAAQGIVLFNLIYLSHLLILRLLIPTPKEGRYRFVGAGRLQPAVFWAALIAILTRARYQAPFPGFLVFHIANLPPFCWLVKTILGPKSRSVLVLDPPIPDPDFTEIGRNVTIGWGSSITAHIQDREGVTVKKVVVEDDVMIGAEVLIYGGCTIKRGAVIYGGAVVRPDTVIGENEAWGGVPARKIKDLPPLTW